MSRRKKKKLVWGLLILMTKVSFQEIIGGAVNSKTFKKIFISLLIIISILVSRSDVFAIPTLQLDIAGGTYNSTTQTIIASGNPFTLYAYLIQDRWNLLNDSYYISAAIVPKVTPPGSDLGSFVFNGQTISVTGQMIYGVPPLEDIVALQGWDSGDLPKHGIFSTYFSEFEFQFSSSQISQYNTQDRAKSGDSIPTSGTGMYYVAFNVDTSLLDPDYVIHFDLYNTKLKCGGDIDITQFAPFSHDAESKKVPEPSTLLLLGAGLIGLGLMGRRKFRTKP
jgi:hypothetical protein